MSFLVRGLARIKHERQVMAHAVSHASRGHRVIVALHRRPRNVEPLRRMAERRIGGASGWRRFRGDLMHDSGGHIAFVTSPGHLRGMVADVVVASVEVSPEFRTGLDAALESSPVGELVTLQDGAAHG